PSQRPPPGRSAWALCAPRRGQRRQRAGRDDNLRGLSLLQPRELHVILDNSSSHGTPDVRAWLAQNPQVHFHYTPTSASWLNQVEGFFGILGKQSLSLTDFYSTRALREHLAAYMRAWNRHPPPFAGTEPALS